MAPEGQAGGAGALQTAVPRNSMPTVAVASAGPPSVRLGRGTRALRWAIGTGKDRGRVGWFAALLAATCFEGLGRKYLVSISPIVFYFMKDVILVAGMVSFGVRGPAKAAARNLYGGFRLLLGVGVVWTVLELFNPSQKSLLLGLVGLRAYWLWWIAPFVIANALPRSEDRRRAIVILGLLSVIIAFHAWQQFNAPASARINSLAYYEGEAQTDIAQVHTTGRVRVASTFAYLSSFADYGALIPTLLLALAVDSKNRTMRLIAVGAAALILATVGMTGSRMGFGLAVVGLVVVAFTSGFARTRAGRWTVALAVAGTAVFLVLGSEAMKGLEDRWEGEDTRGRLDDVLMVLPPLAIARSDYALMGIGTGMMQNSRYQLGGVTEYYAEEEPPRLLMELGVAGYLIVWATHLGLMLALIKMYRGLRRAGARGAASGALAMAAVSMFGRLVFDHIWQALFFTCVGILLSHYVAARGVLESRRRLGMPGVPVREQAPAAR